MQKIPSPRIDTAERTLKGGLHHYLLLLFEFKTNFENEAKICVPLIHQSIELLMREYFEDRLDYDFEVKPKTMNELIKEYGWYRKEHKDAVVWINKQRNQLIHKGWTDTSNRTITLRNLGESAHSGDIDQ